MDPRRGAAVALRDALNGTRPVLADTARAVMAGDQAEAGGAAVRCGGGGGVMAVVAGLVSGGGGLAGLGLQKCRGKVAQGM